MTQAESDLFNGCQRIRQEAERQAKQEETLKAMMNNLARQQREIEEERKRKVQFESDEMQRLKKDLVKAQANIDNLLQQQTVQHQTSDFVGMPTGYGAASSDPNRSPPSAVFNPNQFLNSPCVPQPGTQH